MRFEKASLFALRRLALTTVFGFMDSVYSKANILRNYLFRLQYTDAVPSCLRCLGAPSGGGAVCAAVCHADRATGAGTAPPSSPTNHPHFCSGRVRHDAAA